MIYSIYIILLFLIIYHSNKYVIPFAIFLNIIILLTMIFITIYRKQNIIADVGYIKIKLLLIGLLIYSFHFYFNSFHGYGQCALKYYMKNTGNFLIYLVFLIYLFTSQRLGLNHNDMDRLKLNAFQSNEKSNVKYTECINNSQNGMYVKNINIENNNSNNYLNNNKNSKIESFSETIMNSIENALNNYNKNDDNEEKTLENKTTSRFSINTKKATNFDILKQLNKNVSSVHSFYTEVIYLFIIINIINIMLIALYARKTDKYLQVEYNNYWRYECPLNHIDVIANLITFTCIIYLLVIILKIWNYVYIFKFVRYISYSTFLWIVLGPITNVNIIYIYYSCYYVKKYFIIIIKFIYLYIYFNK